MVYIGAGCALEGHYIVMTLTMLIVTMSLSSLNAAIVNRKPSKSNSDNVTNKDGADDGHDRKPEAVQINTDNVSIEPEHGNSRPYTLNRLKRESPGLFGAHHDNVMMKPKQGKVPNGICEHGHGLKSGTFWVHSFWLCGHGRIEGLNMVGCADRGG